MADNTAIEWTDATWNPIRGCSRVSEGCRHCYAESIAARFSSSGQPYEGLARMVEKPGGASEARWTGAIGFASERTMRLPLHWTKPRRIFVNSMSDLFHENVPDEVIDRVFAIMAFCPQHTFQILTKRPERMRRYFQLDRQEFYDRHFEALSWVAERSRFTCVREAHEHHGIPWQQPSCAEDNWPLPNVWLGVSVEDQVTADTRIRYLRETPAAVRFLSCEPLLGPIQIPWQHGGIGPVCSSCTGAGHYHDNFETPCPDCGQTGDNPRIHWVIAGGESGPNARPMHPDWVSSLRDQCAAAAVPFFFKQWGTWEPRDEWSPNLRLAMTAIDTAGATVPFDVPPQDVGGHRFARVGRKAAGRTLDGQTHDAFPEARHE